MILAFDGWEQSIFSLANNSHSCGHVFSDRFLDKQQTLHTEHYYHIMKMLYFNRLTRIVFECVAQKMRIQQLNQLSALLQMKLLNEHLTFEFFFRLFPWDNFSYRIITAFESVSWAQILRIALIRNFKSDFGLNGI